MKHGLKLSKPKIISNISGNHIIDQFVKFNPFPEISETKFDFFHFRFSRVL